jgi:hypothetical protein
MQIHISILKFLVKGMGLPEEVSLSLVLGRLFKLHPNFDVVLAGILISSPENSMVILIAEKINDWNQLIYDRIYNRVIDLLKGIYNIDSDIADTSHDTSITRLHPDNSETPQFKLLAHADLIIKKLRFLNYDFYGDLLQVATVILDTFPYGGMIFIVFFLWRFFSVFLLVFITVFILNDRIIFVFLFI